jgi:GNAT superfamily N-acetyltransferase
MKPVQLHDRNSIEAFLRRNVFLHIYAIGDLDDFFWPYTTWFAHRDDGGIRLIALLYSGSQLPTLLAITDERIEEMRAFLGSIKRLLPRRFYSHLSEGLSDLFADSYRLVSNGVHYKMGLSDRSKCSRADIAGVEPISKSDIHDLEEFYELSYPGHWFEPRMLETGHYYGIRQDGKLLSVAGVHVYSKIYRVAALGNIATLPDHRGKGLASKVTARLCQSLLQTVEHIGLNVKTDNRSAIACYEKLGFEPIGTYEECMLEDKA